jgi:hypothetical protein
MRDGRIFLPTVIMISLLVITSMISNASATSNWVTSDKLPNVRHTVNNPGSVKICGDHKCSPFENMKKSLEEVKKQNQAPGFIKKSYFPSSQAYHMSRSLAI